MKSNKGFSLIFVIIATTFVGVLVAILMHISIINIRMKDMNRRSEKNFYSTESVLDMYVKDLEQYATEMMKKAYKSALEEYDPTEFRDCLAGYYITDLVTGGDDALGIYEESDYKLNYEEKYFPEKHAVMKSDFTVTGIPLWDGGTNRIGSNTAIVKNLASYGSGIISFGDSIDVRLNMTEDSSKGKEYERALVIKNVKVREEQNGVETIIKTDIKIKVPEISFTQADIYPEYTKYALIADHGVVTDPGSGDTKVVGNLYAGSKGIQVQSDKFAMDGNTLITRGDVVVKSSTDELDTSLNVNNIWAENIKTEGGSDGKSLKLFMNGTVHVSNDLLLNGKNSVVNIIGKYKGFSFNTNNDSSATDKSSTFSSAILVNGRNSQLNMNLTEGLLAGRAFVSATDHTVGFGSLTQSDANGELMLGQSLGIKSDQIVYMVPADYLKNKTNPITLTEGGADIDVDEFDFGNIENAATREEIKSFLNPVKPVVRRYYKMSSGVILCYLFYNFKDNAAATTYYEHYWLDGAKGEERLAGNASKYVSDTGINMSIASSLLSGSIATVGKDPATGEMTITDKKIPYEKREVLTGDALSTLDQSKKTTAYQLGRTELLKYARYQLGLQDTSSIPNPDGYGRFVSRDETIYPENRMYRKVLPGYADFDSDASVPEFENRSGSYPVDYEGSGVDSSTEGMSVSGNYAWITHLERDEDGATLDTSVYLIHNDGEPISLSKYLDYSGGGGIVRKNQGIVVTSGDLVIDRNFTGMIICGGNATIKPGVQLIKNEELVQKSLKKLAKDDPFDILKYFAGFTNVGTGGSAVTGDVKIAAGFAYENWSKNAQ